MKKIETVRLSFYTFEKLSDKAKQRAIVDRRKECDALTSDETIVTILNDCIFREDGSQIKPNKIFTLKQYHDILIHFRLPDQKKISHITARRGQATNFCTSPMP